MNTKDKAIKKNPIIKTLSTTLACLVASSALALDDRNDLPKPDDEPEPEHPQAPARPDLVPMGLGLKCSYAIPDCHTFDVKVVVANFGTADCTKPFACHFGWKVIATKDPVKYPVGFTTYTKDYVIFDQVKVMEVAEQRENASVWIPDAVTAVEVFLVVDRWYDDAYMQGMSDFAGTWIDDTGKSLKADIDESNESNNVLGGKMLYFEDYNPTEPVYPPLVEKSPLPVRKK